jgi:hypothetical protein
MSESRLLKGSCLCGGVTYDVRDEFSYSLMCHCSQCRRATGSAFKPFAGIERHKLAISAGEENTLRFGDATTYDVHCRTCGSLLYSVVRDSQYAHVTLGTLIDDPAIRPTAHIFVDSKAPWHAINDDLPQHAGFPT